MGWSAHPSVALGPQAPESSASRDLVHHGGADKEEREGRTLHSPGIRWPETKLHLWLSRKAAAWDKHSGVSTPT